MLCAITERTLNALWYDKRHAWLGAVLVICYLVDRKLYPAAGLGRWLTLRWRLSAVATLSCLVGAGAL